MGLLQPSAVYSVAVLLLVALSSCDAVSSLNVSSLPLCPFSRWQGDPRYCYECRWCPFRSLSCCEVEDEIDMLKSVNVSGTDDWDCFITIVHFQQCGRCAPSARSYVQQVDLSTYYQNYVWDWRNLTIRPCKQACQYIYRQCNGAKLLNGNPIIPNGIDEGKFCDAFPAYSTPEMPCYNAGGLQASLTTLVAALFVIVSLL